jgi:hypothetical protein
MFSIRSHLTGSGGGDPVSVRREAFRRWGFLLQIPLQMQQNAEPAAASAPPVNGL